MTEEYKKEWTLLPSGIYKTKFPKNITFTFATSDMTSVIHDYVSKNNQDIQIMVLIDGSEVEICPDSILAMLDHAIIQYPKSKMATYKLSKEFKRLKDEYYKTHERLTNNSNFETEEEALNWLLEKS